MRKQVFFLLISLFPIFGFSMSSKEALSRLLAGNRRYFKERQNTVDHTYRREKSRKSQMPFATIVCCSDSRVSPEILFDQSIGDLFVVRVAGNVIGDLELESIQYAVEHLKTALVLIYGHQRCGAVEAVFTGHGDEIPKIAKKIEPAVEAAKRSNQKNLLHAIKLNAMFVKKGLSKNSFIKSRVENQTLQVVAGYYDFDTGSVNLLNQPLN